MWHYADKFELEKKIPLSLLRQRQILETDIDYQWTTCINYKRFRVSNSAHQRDFLQLQYNELEDVIRTHPNPPPPTHNCDFQFFTHENLDVENINKPTVLSKGNSILSESRPAHIFFNRNPRQEIANAFGALFINFDPNLKISCSFKSKWPLITGGWVYHIFLEVGY